MTREEAAKKALEIAESIGESEVSISENMDMTVAGISEYCYVRIGRLLGDHYHTTGETFEQCLAIIRGKCETAGPAAKLEKLRAEVAELEKIVDPRD